MDISEKSLSTQHFCTIHFQPADKSIKVPAGTLIIDAAAMAGITLDTPCGGQGRCGRCLARVEKSASGSFPPQDNPHLTARQKAEGWILTCLTKVADDLTLFIPARREREKIVVQTAASRVARPVECEWAKYPEVRRIYLELPPPSLEDNASDLERLKTVLLRNHNIENISLDVSMLRQLPRALREGNWNITITLEHLSRTGDNRLIQVAPGKKTGPLLGLAVDIGTTNVVMDLVDLVSGKILSGVSTRNGQVIKGEDVISRIVYSEKPGGLEELQRLVVSTINSLLREMCEKQEVDSRDIHEMIVAGNTTMSHLFLGVESKQIRYEPYVPAAMFFPVVQAGDLGVHINPKAPVYCVPAIAAYVGGDVTSGVLISCLFQKKNLTLFLDVGTNGELVLGNSDWMTTCACSAGPAFEGAGVRHGMRATTGAIQEVRINSKTLVPTIVTIDDVPPMGICGSGLISAVAEMLLTGVINRSGRINRDLAARKMGDGSRVREGEHGMEYILARAAETGIGEDIVLSDVDINNIVRAKAAIFAGIATMARLVGISLEAVEEVLIGGAFGQHINVEQAIQIGLLPDLPWEKYKFLGNTSLHGAYNMLLSKQARLQCEDLARKMTYLELIADNSFMNELTAALFLPHTNLDLFPTMKDLLE